MTEYLVVLAVLVGAMVGLWGPVRRALVTHAVHLDSFIRRPVP